MPSHEHASESKILTRNQTNDSDFLYDDEDQSYFQDKTFKKQKIVALTGLFLLALAPCVHFYLKPRDQESDPPPVQTNSTEQAPESNLTAPFLPSLSHSDPRRSSALKLKPITSGTMTAITLPEIPNSEFQLALKNFLDRKPSPNSLPSNNQIIQDNFDPKNWKTLQSETYQSDQVKNEIFMNFGKKDHFLVAAYAKDSDKTVSADDYFHTFLDPEMRKLWNTKTGTIEFLQKGATHSDAFPGAIYPGTAKEPSLLFEVEKGNSLQKDSNRIVLCGHEFFRHTGSNTTYMVRIARFFDVMDLSNDDYEAFKARLDRVKGSADTSKWSKKHFHWVQVVALNDEEEQPVETLTIFVEKFGGFDWVIKKMTSMLSKLLNGKIATAVRTQAEKKYSPSVFAAAKSSAAEIALN